VPEAAKALTTNSKVSDIHFKWVDTINVNGGELAALEKQATSFVIRHSSFVT